MKTIRFTDHAQERMQTRELTINKIESVVRTPHQIVPDEENLDRQIYQSKFTDLKGRQKLLRVVVEETSDEIVVITTYATSQISRYWRT